MVIIAALTHVILYAKEWAIYRAFLDGLSELVGSEPLNEGDILAPTSQLVILCGSFLIGPPLAFLLNVPHSLTGHSRLCFAWDKWVLHRTILNNDFELLLARCAYNEMPIMFTLDGGKVYVGWLIRAPNPSESRKSIRILPMLSGFRDHETHAVEFTTDYLEALQRLTTEQESKLAPEDVEIVFPADRIVSSHPFDVELYWHFQASARELIKESESVADTDQGERP